MDFATLCIPSITAPSADRTIGNDKSAASMSRTAQRGGEMAAMRWADVDLQSGWWTIPSTSSKNKLAHRVPLNKSALDVLRSLRPVDLEKASPYVLGAWERRAGSG